MGIVPLMDGGNMSDDNDGCYQTVPSFTPSPSTAHARHHLQYILNSNQRDGQGASASGNVYLSEYVGGEMVEGRIGNVSVNEYINEDNMENENDIEGEDEEDDIVYGLPECYIEVCVLGNGAFGTVILAKDTRNNRLVAVKRLMDALSGGQERAKSCFRELYFLRHLSHPNLIKLHDAFVDEHKRDLFLVTEYVQNDLRNIINNTNELLPIDRIRRIMKQLLQVLAYLHKNGVVHRDLKPENILLTANDSLKLCDLGLARHTHGQLTGYLATRYYRAPEFMLTWRSYGDAVDTWAAGCVLAELATGQILFPGADHVHHLRLIIKLVGSPSQSVLEKICSPATRKYVSMLPHHDRADFSELFGARLGRDGVALLEGMLEFDPNKRISPSEALSHPFLSTLPTDPLHEETMRRPMMVRWTDEIISEQERDADWLSRLWGEIERPRDSYSQ